MTVSSIDSLQPLQAGAAKTAGGTATQDFSALLLSELSSLGGDTEDADGLGGLFGSAADGAQALSSSALLSAMPALLSSQEGNGDLKSAVLLFCMLMGSGVSGSSMGAAMSSLSSALAGVPGDARDSLRSDVLSLLVGDGYDRTLLQRANGSLFANSAMEARTPFDASKAANPAVTSASANRSAQLYRRVIDQFQVESNPRYAVNKKGDNDTYCNIFLWDVTRAMGAEIPHYVDAQTQEAKTYPDVSGARELNANGIYDWLGEKGADYGWVQVSAEQAQRYANQGLPAVTAWKNPDGGHGHVQVVCPSDDGGYDAARGVTIAQAGRTLTGYAPIKSVYGERLGSVVYYAHA